MLYHEGLFVKAEAYALKGEYANCQTALDAAITADMMYEGVAGADITTYLAQPALTVPTNIEGAQKLVIEQKYIAMVYETYESYFDFIRTGYPVLDFENSIQNAADYNTFPRRYMYPTEEIDKNPNIQALGQATDYLERGTAWDRKSFAWRTK